MSSVSRTSSSLGNTALRGFGGLASGIDRDALIEQMTARTTSKITSKKQAMTKLEWKRDAYRSISNKIIDLQDNYLSYSATKSLKNSVSLQKTRSVYREILTIQNIYQRQETQTLHPEYQFWE